MWPLGCVLAYDKNLLICNSIEIFFSGLALLVCWFLLQLEIGRKYFRTLFVNMKDRTLVARQHDTRTSLSLLSSTRFPRVINFLNCSIII